ncbi:MAG: hypothetical protein ABSC55_25590 [Syntrophorhabdales bacterium]|jgi:hypothetical protein
MDYVVLSLYPYPGDFLDDASLKERRLSELSVNIDTVTKQIATIDQRISGRDPCSLALLKDSEFMDADQKRKVLTQWDRFIKGGFSFHLFTDNLYQHLILHCGFIAHYNRSGFYATYWCDDLVTLARQSGLILRPAPGVFTHWERFLGTFQCWHEWEEMGTRMLHTLRSHLVSLRSELGNEVLAIFRYELQRLYPLHVAERKRLADEADALREKLAECITSLDDMDVDSFLEEKTQRYRALFPSLDPENFVEARLAGNLF